MANRRILCLEVLLLLRKELEYLERFAGHEWNREYIKKGIARTAFLFKKIGEYIPLENKRLLDLGCGMGNVSVLGSKYSSYVVGLDISMKAVRRTKWRMDLRQIKDVHLVNGDALKLPFIDEVFDLVIAYDLYEHVSNQGRLLEEILRVTNKKGFLVLTTGNRLFPFDRHTQLWFVDYLPKKLATQYVRLANRGNSYRVFQPTYWSLLKKLRKYSKATKVDGDSVLNLVEDVYPIYFQKYRKIIPSLKVLAGIGMFKFVTPKFIVISQKL